MYSFALSLTSALDEGWSTQRPGRFTPAKETQYPFYRRLGGHQALSGQVRKVSPAPGSDPRTIQSLVICYTDYTILLPNCIHCYKIIVLSITIFPNF